MHYIRKILRITLISLAAVCVFAADIPPQPWTILNTGIDTNLRGLSVKCEKNKACVLWVSGSNGVVLRSIDDGKTWKQLAVPDARDLDFRDVEAFDANTAYLMSSGDGQKSRIYKTTDGGASWKLQYSDPRPSFFLDSLACDSPTYCVAISDPVDGKFPIIATNDGEHWTELAPDAMPAALPQEGAFAASGTVITFCQHKIFFATGGPAARIFRSSDSGHLWKVVNTPIVSGNASSGIFSVACYSHSDLVTVGGDYKNPESSTNAAAYSSDRGITWQLAQMQPGGFRSAVAWMSGKDLIAVGPNGADISHDKGMHWSRINSTNLNAIVYAGERAWAAGPKGTVVVLSN
ncbi:MAG TPA: YCF48-related protein [Terriglobales bacterium]|jgi:photosystem II stability/assembly factor-like uncharacterized protein